MTHDGCVVEVTRAVESQPQGRFGVCQKCDSCGDLDKSSFNFLLRDDI